MVYKCHRKTNCWLLLLPLLPTTTKAFDEKKFFKSQSTHHDSRSKSKALQTEESFDVWKCSALKSDYHNVKSTGMPLNCPTQTENVNLNYTAVNILHKIYQLLGKLHKIPHALSHTHKLGTALLFATNIWETNFMCTVLYCTVWICSTIVISKSINYEEKFTHKNSIEYNFCCTCILVQCDPSSWQLLLYSAYLFSDRTSKKLLETVLQRSKQSS